MKNLFFAILLITLPSIVFAQKNREEIESFKITYLTQKLDLSPEEAKVFWPIYNNWQKERNVLRKERTLKMISSKKINEIEDLSDAEIKNLITNELDFKQRELNLEKKYFSKLISSLPIKIVGKYYRTQETFKRELLKRFKDGRMQKP